MTIISKLMETIIRVQPEELKMELLDKIRQLIRGEQETEITIHLKQKSAELADAYTSVDYFAELAKSVKDMEEGRTVSFTMDELNKYVHENFPA